MRCLILAIALLALGHDCARAAAAQNQKNNKNSQSTQQAKQELDAAKDKLKDANQDLNKAEKEVEKAEAAHRSAVAKIQKARQDALAEHGKKLGLPTAAAQHTAAQRAFDTAHAAFVKEVRTSADHQAAAKAAEEASARMQKLRDDSGLSTEKRQQVTAELAKILRRPVDLERERTETDSNLQQLRLKIGDAGKQVASIQGQAAKAAEDDSDVKAAVQAEREALEKLKTARAEVDKEKKDVAAAQKKATTEAQQLQKAQAQSASKNKKGKNDK